MRFRFILAEKANYPVTTMCRVLRVTRSGFYAWSNRKPSKRDRTDRAALVHIRAIHRAHRGRYGSPRIHRELKKGTHALGRHRIARLMRLDGITARAKRRFRVPHDGSTTKRIAPNRLRREFRVAQPNRVWLGDITYLHTANGWIFLSCFLDLHSRCIVGWSVSPTLEARATCHALQRAARERRPGPHLLVHSDRGVQYAGEEFQRLLRQLGFVGSMSRKGNCWDNAPMESFFATLKRELALPSMLTAREVERLIGEYIDYYNHVRLHSALDYMTPSAYEESVAA